MALERERARAEVEEKAEARAEERMLDILAQGRKSAEREAVRGLLREGQLDGEVIESETSMYTVGAIMTPPGMEEMGAEIERFMEGPTRANRGRRPRPRWPKRTRQSGKRRPTSYSTRTGCAGTAMTNAAQNGIVFIDEIDKVAKQGDAMVGASVSREGVQRDLLPLVEGCTVATRHGHLSTEHVLFVASGAFHDTKPSDLIPELQGRLPIRVELEALGKKEMARILTEPEAALTNQYRALLATDGANVEFTADAIEKIAEIAEDVNTSTENIGAGGCTR